MVSSNPYRQPSAFELVSLISVVCGINSSNVPIGGTYTSIIRVNPETSTGHTLLVLRQIMIQHNNFIEIEKWMKGNALKKWESTLDLCVHAHGYDVELIIKASCNENYLLGIS